jgi:hydroxyethylthiazole kinase-like uncharacterized protein yjeF
VTGSLSGLLRRILRFMPNICAMRLRVGRFVNGDAMTELLTAAQMRAIEVAAIASGEVTGLELMERAGRGVVDAVFEEWPEFRATSHRAVVLCGPGNNGGDGFVVARLLKEWGWDVEVFLYGTPEAMPPDARVNYERWLGMGEVKPLTGAEIDRRETIPDICVDALFGTGQNRPLPWDLADAVQHLATTFLDGVPVVAVDLPTGVMSDSGLLLSVAEGPLVSRAYTKYTPVETLGIRLTVTFHTAKVGHYTCDGAALCGKIVVWDIGLKPWHSAAAGVA